MVRRRLRNGLDRFLAILDGEGVALFQGVVYLHVIAAGVYLLTAARGDVPQAVEETLGKGLNSWWLWLCLGPAVCLVGKALSARTDKRAMWVYLTGLWAQLAGDVFAFGALVTYTFATLETSWWGKAVFAVFVCASIADCIALLILRDIRRIDQAERVIRQ